MLLDQSLDSVDLLPAEAVTALQAHRVEPELRLAVVAFDVNVWRLTTVACVEEESKRPAAKDSRHSPMLCRLVSQSNAARIRSALKPRKGDTTSATAGAIRWLDCGNWLVTRVMATGGPLG